MNDVVVEATGTLTRVQLTAPIVTDNLDLTPTVTNDAPSAGLPLGANWVTWTARDDAGNVATTLQKVTLVDTTPPLITAPADVVVDLAISGSTYNTEISLGTAYAEDTVDSSPNVINDAPTDGFPLGTTIVTWTATDSSGNSATDTQLVTVLAAGDGITDASTSGNSSSVEGSTVVTSSGNNTSPSYDNTNSSSSMETSSASPLSYSSGGGGGGGGGSGSTSSSDSSSNPPTVTDSTPPTIIPPPTLTANATGPRTILSIGSPIVSDTQDSNPTVKNDAPADGFPLGTTIVTWTAKDAAGNSAIAEQRIVIEDKNPPSLIAPADIIAIATGSLTKVLVGTPTVTDLVDPSPIIRNDLPIDGFLIGNTTVTWTATDISGNSATATQLVRVLQQPDTGGSFDGNPPKIVPPPDIQIQSTGTLTRVGIGIANVSDVEDPSPTFANDLTYLRSAPPGAAAYWSFDHDANDNSDHGNNGTINGAILVDSEIGRAFAFRDHESIVIPASSSLKVNGSFSISAWINLDTLDTKYSYPRILEKSDSAGNRYQMFYSKSTHSVGFGFSSGGQLQQITSNKTDWSTGKWYHIVGIYDANMSRDNMKIYVNGLVDKVQTKTGRPVINQSEVTIGSASRTAESDYFEGKLDEIRIYNSTLTTAQVLDLYDSPFVLLPLGTTAVTWTATDSSGNSAVAKQYGSISNLGADLLYPEF